MVKASGPAYPRSWLGKTSADTFLIIARSNSAKTPIHLEHGLTCRGRGIESLLVQEQIDAKRVQLGPNKVLEAAARGAPGSVSSEGQRRTLARQMKRWRASLNPSRSPGTVGEKRKLGVPNGVLDVLVPEVVLQAARIDAPVGQL